MNSIKDGDFIILEKDCTAWYIDKEIGSLVTLSNTEIRSMYVIKALDPLTFSCLAFTISGVFETVKVCKKQAVKLNLSHN